MSVELDNDVGAAAAICKQYKVDVVIATAGRAATLVQKQLADAANYIRFKFLLVSYSIVRRICGLRLDFRCTINAQ